MNNVVNADGSYQLGRYTQAFERANMLDARMPYVPRFLQKLRLREWQAFQITNDRFFAMIALYNAKKFGLVQFILYDIQKNEKLRYERQVLPSSLTLPDSLYKQGAGYRSKGFHLQTYCDLERGRIEIKASIDGVGKMPPLLAHFIGYCPTDKIQPIAVCLPFDDLRAMYSYKCLMPVQGQVQIDDQRHYFSSHTSAMIIDDHKGYYPSPTHYDWATGMGYDEQNNLIGFNLTDNQARQPHLYNENCLWYKGITHLLPPVKMNQPNGSENEWLISDEQGKVNLSFSPVAHTYFNKNLLFMRSKYHSPYGYFNGYLTNKDGERVPIQKLFGVCEDFYLKI